MRHSKSIETVGSCERGVQLEKKGSSLSCVCVRDSTLLCPDQQRHYGLFGHRTVEKVLGVCFTKMTGAI